MEENYKTQAMVKYSTKDMSKHASKLDMSKWCFGTEGYGVLEEFLGDFEALGGDFRLVLPRKVNGFGLEHDELNDSEEKVVVNKPYVNGNWFKFWIIVIGMVFLGF